MRIIILTFLISLFAAAAPVAFAQTEPATPPPATPEEIPDAVLRGDVMVILSLDLVRGDKTAWINAWTVLLGGKPSTRPAGENDPLPVGIEQPLGPLYKMGADRIAYAISVDNNTLRFTLCVHLKPSASPDAADAWVRKSAPELSRFDREGDWLVAQARTSGAVHDTRPLSPRADEIRQDINCGGDDLPVKAIYLPSDRLKRMMLQSGAPPAVIAPIVNLFWNARYLYFGAKLGAHPAVDIRWVAPDAAGAGDFMKAFTAACDDLKQPNNELQIPSFIPAALGQLQSRQEGNTAYFSADEKRLNRIVATLMAGAMSQQNAASATTTTQTRVAADWKPTDAATDSATGQMRLILSAITEYDRLNHALPNSLDDLVTAKLLPGPEVFHNPRTNKDNGFIYVKPEHATKLNDLPTPAKVAILFEEKEGNSNPKGLIGYANGTVAPPTPDPRNGSPQ